MNLAKEELKQLNDVLKNDMSKKGLAEIYTQLFDTAPMAYYSKDKLRSSIRYMIGMQLRSYALGHIVV